MDNKEMDCQIAVMSFWPISLKLMFQLSEKELDLVDLQS